MSLLSIGTVAFDAIETPFGKTDKIIGGSCTYISLAASYFTPKVNISAVIGDDFPESDIRAFNERNINTEGLQIKEGEKTFFWSGKYHNDMNTRDTLQTDLNVLEDFDPVLPDSYQDCDFLMLGNLTPSIQKTVIDRMKKRPKFVAMDTMNLWMDIAMADLKKVLKMVDILIINDEEARQLSGEYSLVRAAKAIQQMGPNYLIIKKGEHGALLFNKNKIFHAPALPLEEVFDPTGAGDTFAGGFMGYLAKTGTVNFENMKKAIIFGSAMASFCVEKFGPERLLDLTPLEISERVKQFIELTDFSKEF
ncbi:MAG: PfkB family carbohydrate kinase [Cytophagales bacterium]|nr:PfkB family carbohydrate kinase [Cytophagales bacterium]